jgi:hypothetical protein
MSHVPCPMSHVPCPTSYTLCPTPYKNTLIHHVKILPVAGLKIIIVQIICNTAKGHLARKLEPYLHIEESFEEI